MKITRACPFCTATPEEYLDGVKCLAVELIEAFPIGIYQVVCAACGTRGPKAVSEEKAIDDWNEGRNVTF